MGESKFRPWVVHDQWSYWDQVWARKKGWCIAYTLHSGMWFIARDLENPRFNHDNSARHWVELQASRGSSRYERALRALAWANLTNLPRTVNLNGDFLNANDLWADHRRNSGHNRGKQPV